MEELAEGAGRAGKSLDKAGKAGLTFGDILKANLLSDAIAAGARKLADALEAVGRAVLDLGWQSLEGFSQFEQLSGGVKTLFGTEAGSLEEYAWSVGESMEEAKVEYERLIASQQTAHPAGWRGTPGPWAQRRTTTFTCGMWTRCPGRT